MREEDSPSDRDSSSSTDANVGANGGVTEPADVVGTRSIRGPWSVLTGTQSATGPGDWRTAIERIGLAVTGALAVAMLAFILLDWLRQYPYAESYGAVETLYEATRIDPAAGTAHGQFIALGGWLDHFLGTSIFRFEFYWRSIATGVLIGIVAPLVGSFVVHREMALIGETLAHTAFAGIAVGLLLTGVFGWWNAPLLVVALVVGVLGALGVQWLTERTGTYGDVPIAIVLVGSFAVGTLLIEWARSVGTVTIDIEAYLFGNITIVPSSGARLMAVLSVVVVAVVAVTYKQLLFITFDEQAARVAQLEVGWYNTLLIVMTAVVVVGSMQILGVILVAAMLVVPVAAASQLARSFRETITLSILFGELSIIAGFAFAFSQNLPPGGSIVVAAIVIYLLAVLGSTKTTALTTH